MKKIKKIFSLSIIAAGAALAFAWLECRVFVEPGKMAIVTAKTGRQLPPGRILAEAGERGVRREPLPEGRHFLNPVTRSWRIVPVVDIPLGKVGIVTSKVGKELPEGEILAADSSYKGVWKDALGPGAYRLNPDGCQVTLADAVNIPIGYVGIVTSQTGAPAAPGEFAGIGEKGVMKDVLQPGLYYINPKAYQIDVLEIGMNQVSILGRAGSVVITKGQISSANEALDDLRQNTIQSQQNKRQEYIEQNRGLIGQTDLAQNVAFNFANNGYAANNWNGEAQQNASPRKSLATPPSSRADKSQTDAAADKATQNERARALAQQQVAAPAVPESVAFGIDRFVEFPSRDGFQIMLDMTVEFELLPANISRIYMLYGDLPAVVDKIILPQVLSISRIKGSSYKARDFIDGEGRQLFQKELTEELTRVLNERHIVIHNAIIRHVQVPPDILQPLQASGMSKEQDLTNKARQETARKEAELNTENAMVEQLSRQVEQETKKLVATTAAETKNEVATIMAEAALEVATLNLQRAAIQAEITRLTGESKIQAEFMVANEKAQGETLKARAFATPSTYADYLFIQHFNPTAKISILHAGEGTFWTDLKSFSPAIPVKQ